MSERKVSVYASKDWYAVLNKDDSTVYLSDQGAPSSVAGYVVVPLAVLEAIIGRAHVERD